MLTVLNGYRILRDKYQFKIPKSLVVFRHGMHLCPPIAWKDAYVVRLQRSNVWSAITLWISNDDNLLLKKHTELNREEIYRFPWKSDTFSLDCPESEKLSEICV